MCYPLPGPRCSAHASAALKKARIKYDNAPEDSPLKAEYYNEYCQKRADFFATPKGQKWLEKEIKKTGDPDGLLSRYKELGSHTRAQLLAAFKESDLEDLVKKYRESKSSPEATIQAETVFGSISLTPGLIDDNARIALTTGYCTNFATALHRATGYPIVASFGKGYWKDSEECNKELLLDQYDDVGFVHVMLRTPDGTLLDIEGEHDPDEYCQIKEETYEEVDLFEISPETLSYLQKNYGNLGTGISDLMDSYVQPLLENC